MPDLKDAYVDLAKAVRLMEEAAKKLPPKHPLMKQIPKTRSELVEYMQEIDKSLAPPPENKVPKKIRLR